MNRLLDLTLRYRLAWIFAWRNDFIVNRSTVASKCSIPQNSPKWASLCVLANAIHISLTVSCNLFWCILLQWWFSPKGTSALRCLSKIPWVSYSCVNDFEFADDEHIRRAWDLHESLPDVLPKLLGWMDAPSGRRGHYCCSSEKHKNKASIKIRVFMSADWSPWYAVVDGSQGNAVVKLAHCPKGLPSYSLLHPYWVISTIRWD